MTNSTCLKVPEMIIFLLLESVLILRWSGPPLLSLASWRASCQYHQSLISGSVLCSEHSSRDAEVVLLLFVFIARLILTFITFWLINLDTSYLLSPPTLHLSNYPSIWLDVLWKPHVIYKAKSWNKNTKDKVKRIKAYHYRKSSSHKRREKKQRNYTTTRKQWMKWQQ